MKLIKFLGVLLTILALPLAFGWTVIPRLMTGHESNSVTLVVPAVMAMGLLNALFAVWLIRRVYGR